MILSFPKTAKKHCKRRSLYCYSDRSEGEDGKEIKAELLKQTPRPGGGKDGEDGDDTEGEALAKQLGAERAKTAEAAGESMKHYMGGKS